MTNLRNSVKTKTILTVSMAILVWQFSFPHTVIAKTVTLDEGNADLTAKFEEQWQITQNETLADIRLPENPDRPQPPAKKTVRLTVTAYSSTVDQSDTDPFTTASGTQVHDGTLAANFLPIGTRVRLPDQFGNKIFVVEPISGCPPAKKLLPGAPRL